jgi:hypothetical protein
MDPSRRNCRSACRDRGIMCSMPLVDPADDSTVRFVLEHFRFDPDRNQRRDVVVAAYDNESEFQAAFGEAQAELVKRQEEGSAESVERLSGRVLPAGYSAYQNQRRLAWRRATHGVHPDPEHR